VFPGGQSEDPASPHYADQMLLWCTGKYIPLNAVTKLEDYPADAVAKATTFSP
jgi:acyl-homoserine lactone acylase PvdQ